jgi:hypothetical protein
MSIFIHTPIADLEPAHLESLAYFTAKLAVPVLNRHEHAAATNKGSINLWGSRTSMARMDWDVTTPAERRVVATGLIDPAWGDLGWGETYVNTDGDVFRWYPLDDGGPTIISGGRA